MMIRHILLVQFTSAATDSDIAAVRSAFIGIPDRIEGVESVEWGTNNSPENMNKHYTHCVLMTFKDEAARSRYLPHPAHEELKAVFVPTIEDILVFDYVFDYAFDTASDYGPDTSQS